MTNSNAWDNVLKDTTGKPIFLTKDKEGVAIFLSREVWYDHILSRHPEVDDYKGSIIEAIESPVRVVVKYLHPEERGEKRQALLALCILLTT